MESPHDGVLVLNKPRGVTSHHAVLVARRRLGIRRIGHTGTLDPMAEGVLVLLIGRATRRQQQFQRCRKVYEAGIRLGVQTDTADAWGATIRSAPVLPCDRTRVEQVLASLIGPLSQTPPAFSAVKVDGRPLYWWARKGRLVEAKPRTIEIFSAELLELDGERVRCRVACSSGTYIRTLAETIAERLGTVGHVDQLIRLAVGGWTIERSKDLDWLTQASDDEVRAAITLDDAPIGDQARLTEPVAARAWP